MGLIQDKEKKHVLGLCIILTASAACHPKGHDTTTHGTSGPDTTSDATSTTDTTSTTSTTSTTAEGTGTDSSSTELTSMPDTEDGECGDGKLDSEELCDDGNENNLDGCQEDCKPGPVMVWCHDINGREPKVEVSHWHNTIVSSTYDIFDERVNVRLLNPETGIAESDFSFEFPLPSSVAVAPDKIIFSHGKDTGVDDFLVLDLALNQLPGFGKAGVVEISASENQVLALSVGSFGDGGVQSFTYAGEETWIHAFTDGYFGSLVQSDEIVYIGGTSVPEPGGECLVSRLDATSGFPLNPVWSLDYGDFCQVRDLSLGEEELYLANGLLENEVQKIALVSLNLEGTLKYYSLVESDTTGEAAVPTKINSTKNFVVTSYRTPSGVGILTTTPELELLWNYHTPGKNITSTVSSSDSIYLAWEIDTSTSRMCRFNMN